jgi:hypothetical protein
MTAYNTLQLHAEVVSLIYDSGRPTSAGTVDEGRLRVTSKIYKAAAGRRQEFGIERDVTSRMLRPSSDYRLEERGNVELMVVFDFIAA